ncbi:MAG: DNA translocase FtsK [Oscillospiraceae bacterium]
MAQGAKKKTPSASRAGRKSSTKQAASPKLEKKPYRREIWAVICLFLAIFSFIGYFNVEGWFIEAFCGTLKGILGWGYYIFPFCLLAAAGILGFHHGRPVKLRTFSVLILPLLLGALLQLLLAKAQPDTAVGVVKYISALYASGKALQSGGAVAGLIGIGLKSAFSAYGAVPILIFTFLLFLVIAYNTTIGRLIASLKNRERVEYTPEPEPEVSQSKTPRQPTITGFNMTDIPKSTVTGSAPAQAESPAHRRAIDIPMDDELPVDLLGSDVEPKKSLFRWKKDKDPASESEPAPAENLTADVEPLSVQDAAAIAGVSVVESTSVSSESARAEKKKNTEAVAEETENITKIIEEKNAERVEDYHYPPVTLLKSPPASIVDGREEMALNRDRLSTTLQSFGVSATVADITRGPTVTRYDLELEAGVKLSKITNLAGDLALSLGVTGVRIAPIPNKISTVGIEVPNKIVSMVYLHDIIASPAFKKASSKLSFCIGKDIGGNCIVGNIAKLPHLLIAGTTGSGKSVCMNSLIISLLYKATPEEVRLIMIDPKMVELGIYNGIPHLYVPVVTDPKKAAGALQWAVVEMLKRYRLFSEVGVRDLATYNAYQKKNDGVTMPQVVTVIDELADLMLVASKEVEESICRVAQMGRAAGMHLVIATQRPSADVITGLMKANIPSRIAFAVSSAMESRIILDSQGAEKLIGMGDMLYAPLGVGKPIRIQGAFVSDDEREDIINYIKSGSEAHYSDEILAQIEKAAEEKSQKSNSEKQTQDERGDYDELLPQGVEVIFDTKQASVSMLQRRLKLGYSRAARLVDQMEELGIVGPFEGSKPRKILITREQWQEMQMNGTAPMDAYQEQIELQTIEDTGEEE